MRHQLWFWSQYHGDFPLLQELCVLCRRWSVWKYHMWMSCQNLICSARRRRRSWKGVNINVLPLNFSRFRNFLQTLWEKERSFVLEHYDPLHRPRLRDQQPPGPLTRSRRLTVSQVGRSPFSQTRLEPRLSAWRGPVATMVHSVPLWQNACPLSMFKHVAKAFCRGSCWTVFQIRYLEPDLKTLLEDELSASRIGSKFEKLNHSIATMVRIYTYLPLLLLQSDRRCCHTQIRALFGLHSKFSWMPNGHYLFFPASGYILSHNFQIDDYSLVKFCPLDITSEDTIGSLLYEIDNAIQYGEDQEPREIAVSYWTPSSAVLKWQDAANQLLRQFSVHDCISLLWLTNQDTTEDDPSAMEQYFSGVYDTWLMSSRRLTSRFQFAPLIKWKLFLQ